MWLNRTWATATPRSAHRDHGRESLLHRTSRTRCSMQSMKSAPGVPSTGASGSFPALVAEARCGITLPRSSLLQRIGGSSVQLGKTDHSVLARQSNWSVPVCHCRHFQWTADPPPSLPMARYGAGTPASLGWRPQASTASRRSLSHPNEWAPTPCWWSSCARSVVRFAAFRGIV